MRLRSSRLMAEGGLTSLPLELLQLIFGHFCVHCRERSQVPSPDAYIRGCQQQPDEPSWYSLDCQALSNVSLTCRQLRNAAQPLLYHDFMPGYGDSWRSNLYTWDRRLTLFMRTMAQRRDLAALMKRIYIHPYLLEIFHGVAQDTIREVAPALGISQTQQQDLSAFDLTALLILLLPNLEHFSFQLAQASNEIVRPAVFEAVGRTNLGIKAVDITLRGNTSTEPFWLLWCGPTLFEVSPCIETLNLHMCGGLGPPKRTLFRLDSLKHLQITCSRFYEHDLETILSSCGSLCTFTYEACHLPTSQLPGHFDPFAHGGHFSLSDAVKSLSHHRQMLESVHLDLRRRGHSENVDDLRDTVTFANFTALKHLFLNLDEFHTRFWAGDDDNQLFVQLLPQSISSLHLAGFIGDQLPRLELALSELAQAVSYGQFPQLKEIKWDRNERLNESVEFNVVKIFQNAGISFEYDSWPVTKATLSTPYEDHYIPPPNFQMPEPLSDMEDPDL